MKVLVHYEQEFQIRGSFTIKTVQTITKVFEVNSKQDLIYRFKDSAFIPRYITLSAGDDDIVCGKKSMLWYLPETFQPHF